MFDDVDAAYTHVSWEEVLLHKPDLIVVHAYGDATGGDVGQKMATLRGLEALRALPVTVMPLRYSLGGPKIGEAVTVLRSAIAAAPSRSAQPVKGRATEGGPT